MATTFQSQALGVAAAPALLADLAGLAARVTREAERVGQGLPLRDDGRDGEVLAPAGRLQAP